MFSTQKLQSYAQSELHPHLVSTFNAGPSYCTDLTALLFLYIRSAGISTGSKLFNKLKK